jgi:hypothetical protein
MSEGVSEVSIKDMPAGTFGVDKEGHIYYASEWAAVCLNDVGMTYSGNKQEIDDKFVRVLPPGTVIKITIEQAP